MAEQTKQLSEIPFSILDLASVAAGKTAGEAFKNTLNLAKSAEKLGYKRYWLAEHHNLAGVASSATAVLVGYVAANTTTIRVGSGGIMLPNHAPLIIAEQFGTLESLYPGRIDLGLGRAPGTDGATMRALRRDIARTGHDFPELLAELLGYFAPAKEGQTVRAQPGAGLEIPIWLLGSSDFSARLSAELGMPFAFASHFAPEELFNAIAIYRQYFKPSRSLTKPYLMIGVPVIAADTEREAQRLATTSYQRFLGLVRGQSVMLKPPVDSMDGLWSPYEKAAVASRLEIAAFGSAETVRKKLEKLMAMTNADELMIVTDTYSFEDRLRSYEIVSEFNAAFNSSIKTDQSNFVIAT
ncbi:MAG: LLM class flavin-dependent oxidoreductase [Candidatus Obscuribacterales bacterium]|nr:LLM class flavin-dependent oxidoreductase [Candidatus Obscuribacterales bacterium]